MYTNYDLLKYRDEKTDEHLQAKEELNQKNSQYEKLRHEVSLIYTKFLNLWK